MQTSIHKERLDLTTSNLTTLKEVNQRDLITYIKCTTEMRDKRDPTTSTLKDLPTRDHMRPSRTRMGTTQEPSNPDSIKDKGTKQSKEADSTSEVKLPDPTTINDFKVNF